MYTRRKPYDRKVFVSNETELKQIPESQLQEFLSKGWERGNKHDKQKEQHKKWYNNGTVNMVIKDGDPIPDGFNPGMVSHPGTFSKYKYHWYTNGVDAVRVKEGDPIPEGWRRGQSDQHKMLNSTRQKEKGNYHCLNKAYTDEYKELCKDPEKLRNFIVENNTLTFSQLAERFHCSPNAIALYVYTNQFQTLFSWFRECSQPQVEIADYIKHITEDEILVNTRKVISPKELDIYIPSKKVAIELDGVYFHSTNVGTDPKYHLEKTVDCEKQNIRLIHITDWEWYNKTEICKSLIASALGIYSKRLFARDCTVSEVSSTTSRQFLDRNHIQGAVNCKYNLGLFYNGELVQLLSTGPSRFRGGETELLRFCTKLNTQVVGGFSKLLHHQPYKKMISFIDRSKFNGNGYQSTGWKFVGYTPPAYSYYKENIKLNRLAAQKHKLSNLLGEAFDPSKSESENMQVNGWVQVYDCGNIKVIYEDS